MDAVCLHQILLEAKSHRQSDPMYALGSCSRPAKPSGSSSSLSFNEAVDDVVDDGMRKSSSWAAVRIVDEVLEA